MGTLIKGKGRVRVLCDVARKLSFWPCTPPRRERNRGYKRMDEKGIVSYIWLCILYDVVVLFEWFYGFFFFFVFFILSIDIFRERIAYQKYVEISVPLRKLMYACIHYAT